MSRPDLRAVRSTKPQRVPTLDEIRTWPATVDVPTAGSAFGLGRSTSYDHARAGTLPVPVLHLGKRLVVPTARILALLEAPDAREAS